MTPLVVLSTIGAAIHGTSGWLSGRASAKFKGEVEDPRFRIDRAGVNPDIHVRVRGTVTEQSWGRDVRFSSFVPFQALRFVAIGLMGIAIAFVVGGDVGVMIGAAGTLWSGAFVVQYRKEIEEASRFVHGLLEQVKL